MTNRFMCLTGAVLACMTATVAPAIAQADAIRAFDLPAAPLGRALARFTQETGVIVVADASLTRGKQSDPVKGTFTAPAALAELLRGTGLRAIDDGKSGFVLTSDDARIQPAASPLEQVLVFGRAFTDTTFEVPQTVEVLNASLIERTGSETVGEVLRFVPGAQRDGSPLDAFGDTFLMRGFEVNQTLNGLYANPIQQARDTVGIERVEVLKGPASVLYGQLQPGAVVNIVTKQPERDFGGAATVSYGRFEDFRGTFDLTGPLAADGNVRVRLTGAYDDAGSFVDFWHRKHLFIAPVLAFDIGEATTITIEGFYSRNRLEGFYNGVPAAGTVLPNPNGPLPRSLSLTDPTLAPSIRENGNVSLRIEHRFSDSVSWRAAVDWTHESRDESNILGIFGWEEENRSLTRLMLQGGGKGDNWTVHNDLAIEFSTGGIEHSLVVGGDYTWRDRATPRRVFFLPSLDLYAPVYATSAPPDMTEVPSYAQTITDRSRAAGVFIQDRISLTDQLKVIGGVRWSDFRQTSRLTRPGDPVGSVDEQSDSAWTSQLGLLYTPAEGIALFASRTTSFLPTYGVAADGTALPPETGTQYEAGVKAQVADGRATLGASVFHLERGNVVVADRDNPGFQISIGEQVAKGVELTADIRPVDGLHLYAGYAYTAARTTRDTDTSLEGLRIRNVPKHSLVLHGSYSIQQGALSGLSIAGSATYTGKRAGELANSFQLPSYWRIDASIDYALTDTIALGVTIENLANQRYYDYAYSEFEVWPGAPRTWKLSVRSRF
ncbi:TonB-dependent receptor [Iodidimonas sp. SYSU 1G8]|uniref:TonB-dependent siderophore receptor n=1 Tax=Iodidimonas sp. SYSU 1G8 TaxID=3133967 RepID=UPI0031FEFFBE